MSYKYIILGIVILSAMIVTFIIIGNANKKSVSHSTTESTQQTADKERKFLRSGLMTNTAKTSILLNEVLGGGPGKDGIPAINHPQFVSVADGGEWLDADDRGVLYKNGDNVRFYPYAILYWHEIVNDEVDGVPIAVTFCPLCGTAMVFDRRVDGETLQFGVSGKLYQSNLLMYDTATESLWSQARGEAVVGDKIGDVLALVESSLVTFADIQQSYPEAHVFSRDTGFRRDYDRTPYGDYETNARLMFPTEDFDARFHPKELFVVTPREHDAIGFHLADLREVGKAEISAESDTLTAVIGDDGGVTITDSQGEVLPSYVTMYFSWAVHDDRKKIMWSRSE